MNIKKTIICIALTLLLSNTFNNAYSAGGGAVAAAEERKRTLARTLIDRFADEGYEWAISDKIDALNPSFHQYYEWDPSQIPQGVINFIDHLADQGFEKAMEYKIIGLSEGKFGYTLNLEALREFFDRMSEQRSELAIDRKISGLRYGEYGYEPNPVALREFVERKAEQGSEAAIWQRMSLFRIEEAEGDGTHRYYYFPAAREFVDRKVAEGSEAAIKEKINGMLEDGGNPDATKRFIEEMVARGSLKAIEIKMQGLFHGAWGYERDDKIFRKFILEMGRQGYDIFENDTTGGLFRDMEFLIEMAELRYPEALRYLTHYAIGMENEYMAEMLMNLPSRNHFVGK